MIYRLLGFFYVLFRRKARWMVQLHIATGPSSYNIEKHLYFFARLADRRMSAAASAFMQQQITSWTLYLFDTNTGQAIDFIGAFETQPQQEQPLLAGKPNPNLN